MVVFDGKGLLLFLLTGKALVSFAGFCECTKNLHATGGAIEFEIAMYPDTFDRHTGIMAHYMNLSTTNCG